MTAPDISIVIVNWNTRQLLLDCIQSITETTTKCSFEIIVVDNASTDDSCEAVAKEFPTVRVIRNSCNLGFAAANNVGIRNASGRYVSLINSDVIVNNACLDCMCAYMDSNPDVGVLGPKILNADSTVQYSCREFPGLWNSFCRALALDTIFPGSRLFTGSLMRFSKHDQVAPVDALSGCFWMIRREVLAEVGLLDEAFFMYSEDIDFCRRCWDKSWKVVYYPAVTSIHLGGGSSMRSPVRFELEGLRARLGYWHKHHGRVALALFVLISLLHQLRRMLQGAVLYIVRSSERASTAMELQASLACARWLLSGAQTHRSGSQS